MCPDVMKVLETIRHVRESAIGSGPGVDRRCEHSFRVGDFHDNPRFQNDEKPCHAVSRHSRDHKCASLSILRGNYDRPSLMHVLTHQLTIWSGAS